MAGSRSPSSGWSPYRLAAVGALVLTAASTFLTWTTSSSGINTWGLGHNDGLLVLMGAAIGVGLVVNDIKAAWIAPAFLAMVQMRDVSRVRSTDFDVGLGLWLGLGLALVATVILIADLIFGIQESARLEGDQET